MKKLDMQVNQNIISLLGRKLYASQFATVVLRELIQNALDAQSNRIDVKFDEIDKRLTVIDNGTGIANIDGLLNVIGESYKAVDSNSIGGYGLAKLAIFGCKEWKFLSISGTFKTGFLFDDTEKIESGTIVTVEFHPEDVSYSFESRIKDYLKSINRDVVFSFNDEILTKYDTSACLFGDKVETITNTNDDGYVNVRINGLPSFKRYINNLSKTVIIDYQVTCNPYDTDYPLTSNRDDFVDGCKEKDDLNNRIKAIQEKCELDKRMSENVRKQTSIITWRGKKYSAKGNIDLQNFEHCAKTISTFERYIKQIANILGDYSESMVFGLTDGADGELACYNKSENCFSIRNYSFLKKGEILSLAIHEYTHYQGYGLCGHDQDFVSANNEINGKILESIFNGEFRK